VNAPIVADHTKALKIPKPTLKPNRYRDHAETTDDCTRSIKYSTVQRPRSNQSRAIELGHKKSQVLILGFRFADSNMFAAIED
jgi:hypothetical protein